MFPRPSDRAIVFAALAGTTVLGVAACGGASGQTTSSSPSADPTAVATAASTMSTSTSPGPTASPPVEPSASPTTEGGCGYSALRVRYADDGGGAGAGSVSGTFTFTNTSAASCTLRGFPGVSYVAGSRGDQVGQAATRTDDEATTKTLKAGASVKAALRRTQPGNYGDECGQTKVDGFRVYPPGSKGAVFVEFPTTGCTSTTAPLLQVGPVR